MIGLDATAATAGYKDTKNTQIVHLRKGKGSSGCATAWNLKDVILR